MFFLKVATFLLVALAVGAEKKIELQDIEEDNLRSELKTDTDDHDKSDGEQQNSGPISALGYNSLDFMKNGFLKLFEEPQRQAIIPQQQQQQRYVHQYAVTEPPERYVPSGNKEQYQSDGHQQAMVGYLSNMPMQIYLVPQVQQFQPPVTPNQLAEFNVPPGSTASNTYVQAYVPRTPVPQPVTYVYPVHPTAAPVLAAQPILGYHLPVLHYNNKGNIPRVAASNAPQSYFETPDYSDTNTIDESTTQTAPPPQYLHQEQDYPRHYNSRTPIKGHNKHYHSTIPELPHPHPLLLKAPPAHLSHLPRTLPMLRPYIKQVYQEDLPPSPFAPRPHAAHGPFKRRPTSLLDSYVPSSLQVEYLKRGLARDPSSLYDALASGRLPHTIPRHVERGFLPNQMYPTASGGVTYGHYKRNPKIERFPHK